jgi:Mce-associated membrane protein
VAVDADASHGNAVATAEHVGSTTHGDGETTVAIDDYGATGDSVVDDDAASCRSGARLAVYIGLTTVAVLAVLVGWLGFRWSQSHTEQQQRAALLAAARQGALNLTTISYTEADGDVSRILDSSTGEFRGDFQKRAQAFIDTIKQAQSKSEGTISEAGIESAQGERAQVLVAVSVKTSTGAAEEQPRLWRMRIGVQKVGDGAKVSNVEFVP